MTMVETKKVQMDPTTPSIVPLSHAIRMPPVDIEFCDLTYTVPTSRKGQ